MKKQLMIVGIIVLLITVGLSGCNEQNTDDEDTYTAPVITSFYVEPQSIELWDTAELNWVVSNAESVIIDNGIGYVSLTGSRIISPKNTTTYTLTATNGNKVSNATAQLIVNPINYNTFLIGTWDLVVADYGAGSFYRIVFKSDKTCDIYDTVSDSPYTYYDVGWKVTDDVLEFYNNFYWNELKWTLSYDGTYLSITNKPFPIYAGGGTYEKVS